MDGAPSQPRGGGAGQGSSSTHDAKPTIVVVAAEKRGANIEVYGFVCWTGTGLIFVAYMLWAFLPEEYLHWLGVTYYPSKYWATAFPAWLCLSYFFFQFLFYISMNWAYSTPLDSRYTIADEHTVRLPPDELQKILQKGEVPPLSDTPIEEVNRMLYHTWSPDSDINLRRKPGIFDVRNQDQTFYSSSTEHIREKHVKSE